MILIYSNDKCRNAMCVMQWLLSVCVQLLLHQWYYCLCNVCNIIKCKYYCVLILIQYNIIIVCVYVAIIIDYSDDMKATIQWNVILFYYCVMQFYSDDDILLMIFLLIFWWLFC